MSLGTAALAVELQQLGRRHGLGIKAGDQPEAIEQQLIRPLQHHEHHAARLRPRLRPVGHLVKPNTRFRRGAARRPLEMGPGHALQDLVVAQSGHIRRASPLQAT